MLSMKVSTLRYSYLNKSNRVGLVPRGLHYTTNHGYEKRKSSRQDRIFKVGVKKTKRERERERKGREEEKAFDIFHGEGNGALRPRRNLDGQPCPLLHGNPTSFLFSRQKAIRDSSWQPVTRYQRRRFNIYPQMEGSERGAKERDSGNKLNSFAS